MTASETTHGLAHPRLQKALMGHDDTEMQLRKAWETGRFPHSLLLRGPRGVGKATLAYRLARLMLAQPQAEPKPADSFSLFGEPEPQAIRLSQADHLIDAGTHPDLLVLESENEEGQDKEIPVDAVREIRNFLSLTPAMSVWRVVIVDAADYLNRHAANAILKILEEPPARAQIMLVSHNPGTLLPTIRSRCQAVTLAPLQETDFRAVLKTHATPPGSRDTERLMRLASGAPGLALRLQAEDALAIYTRLLEQVENNNAAAMLKFAESVGSKQSQASWATLTSLLELLYSRLLNMAATGSAPPEIVDGEAAILHKRVAARPAQAWLAEWENTRQICQDVNRLYLDGTQVMLRALHGLAA